MNIIKWLLNLFKKETNMVDFTALAAQITAVVDKLKAATDALVVAAADKAAFDAQTAVLNQTQADLATAKQAEVDAQTQVDALTAQLTAITTPAA